MLAAFHLALLWLLSSQMQANQRSAAEAARPLWASLTLWLRPAPLEKAREKPPEKPVEKRRELATPVPLQAPAATTQDLPPSSETSPPAPANSAETSSSTAPSGQQPGAAGAARAPLRLELPKPGKAGEFTKFHNPALSDPRSNTRIRLTLEEKMAIGLGTVECILEERQPDGSIWRGAGRKITVPAAIAATGAAAAGAGPNASVTQCVR